MADTKPTLQVSTRAHEVAFVFWVLVTGSGLLPGAAVALHPAAGRGGELGTVAADGTFAGEHLGFCYMLPFTVASADDAGASVSVAVDRAPGCRQRPVPS